MIEEVKSGDVRPGGAIARAARIDVFGTFTLRLADGRDATPRGRRAKALLALLVLAPNGRRGRSWLQDRLWSGKDAERGRASLRQELSALRQHLVEHGISILSTAGDDVVIDLASIEVDVFVSEPPAHRELLEGLDLGDPEFENWLSEERAYWYEQLAQSEAAARARRVADAAVAETEPDGRAATPAAQEAEGAFRLQLGARALFPHLVLQPFQPIGDERAAQIFAEGLNDELATVLGAITGTYRIIDTTFDAMASADYRLQGSVRSGAEGLRVHARVTSLEDGAILWNERFDIEEDAGFGPQERISRRIVEAIQTALSDGFWADYWTRSDTSIRAWELFQKGRTQEAFARRVPLFKAIQLYRRALEVDPGFMQARISLAFCLIDTLRLCWHADPEAARVEAGRISRQISADAPDNLFGQALAAYYQCAIGNFPLARALMTDVVERAPESPEMVSYLAAVIGYCGDSRREIELYRHALTLTRHPPIWIRTNLALAQLIAGGSGNGAEIDAILAGDADNLRCQIARTVHLVRKGRMEDARTAAERIRVLEPGFRADFWRAREFFAEPAQHEAIAADLRAAGL